jgi:hypothetical protein
MVIDSDDEPEVVATRVGTKKRRLSEDSDVEIVDVTSFSVKRATVDDLAVENHVAKSKLNSISGSSSSSSTSTFTFGKPQLLLHPSAKSDSGPFAFGAASSLLSSPNQGALTSSLPTFSASSTTKEEAPEEFDPDSLFKAEDSQVDLDLSEDAMEDWLTGDDEIGNAATEADHEDDEIEFVEASLIEGRKGSGDSICPCCGEHLSSLPSPVRSSSRLEVLSATIMTD